MVKTHPDIKESEGNMFNPIFKGECPGAETSRKLCICRDRKCLAMIAQMARAFRMSPKVGGLSHSQVETFSVSKTLTLSQEHPFMCRK